MSSEALYEQYKDALKRGHVASLRGRVEEALLAYAEAARIAPERSTPHSSAGNALLRRKRPAEALQHYEVALTIAPRDEAALLGRAQALAALERRGDAADAFDALADTQAGIGRLADAVDAARRGLEMAEGRERRRTLERLIARLRATEPDEPGRLALEHALLVLEGQAVPGPKPAHRAAGRHATPGTGTPHVVEPQGQPRHEPGEPERAQPDLEGALAEPPEELAETGGALAQPEGAVAAQAAPAKAEAAPAEPDAADVVEAIAEEEPAPGEQQPEAADAEDATPEAAAIPVGRPPRGIPADATPDALEARADAALAAGDAGAALDAKLDLAALHARDGRIEAALDACYEAVSLDPDSVALHLALAELYTQRGWDALADEKLGLLGRIADLDGDEEVAAEVAGLRAARG